MVINRLKIHKHIHITLFIEPIRENRTKDSERLNFMLTA